MLPYSTVHNIRIRYIKFVLTYTTKKSDAKLKTEKPISGSRIRIYMQNLENAGLLSRSGYNVYGSTTLFKNKVKH